MYNCQFCKKEIITKRKNVKFCSVFCSNKSNGKKRAENKSTWNIKKDKIKNCLHCKKDLCCGNFSRVNKFDKFSNLKDICKKCSNLIKEQKRRDKIWQDDARQALIIGAKQRAKSKKIVFDITKEDIFIPEKCPVLNIPLERYTKKRGAGTRKEKENSPSIDRIDNEKGYIKNNVVVVSFRANRLKSDATFEEIEKLYNFYKNNKK